MSVATFDLTSLRAGDTLRSSFESTGFAIVTGHGVDPHLIEEAHAIFGEFFRRSDAEKSRCGGVAGGQRGYTPFGIEHALGHDAPDLKEFFHVGAEPRPGGPPVDQYLANVFPEGLPTLRRISIDLHAALEVCAIALLEALAGAFEVPTHEFAGLVVGGNSILRVLHYPPIPEDADPRALRAAPHEDINLITLLPAATAAGLEIQSRDGRWVPIEPPSGALVVDVGDMLSRITNGVVPATTHRVVNSPEASRSHRYALPFFAHPRPECVLRVLERFVAPGSEPRDPPIRAGDFLSERLRAIGLEPPQA